MWKKLNDTRLLSDFIISVGFFSIFYLYCYYSYGICDMLNRYDDNSSTLISILATILGFLITAVSILLTVKETKYIVALKNNGKYAQLLNSFIQTCYFITINTILLLILTLAGNELIILWSLSVFLTIFMFIRLFTCLIILKKVIDIST